ncbi:MAG: response regulator [bacterium]|nr:response regulator [bacterium]
MTDELPEGDYAFVEITDSGCGIDTEMLDRVFDPFYSTKFTGRGLGLAALLGIVRGHCGNLRVESQSGRGTSFCVLLPYAGPQQETRESSDCGDEGWTATTGTVLVVDDEASVHEVAARMLENLGFHVQTASSGEEAERVLDAQGSEVVVVVLDLTMPGMSGVATFAVLRRTRPQLPVLFASGHAQSDVVEHFGEATLVDFVAKPFTSAQLANKLRGLLGN